jgi:hypothetical protein
MGLFEENPLLLIPYVLIVVIAYDGLKWALRKVLSGQKSRAAGDRVDV